MKPRRSRCDVAQRGRRPLVLLALGLAGAALAPGCAGTAPHLADTAATATADAQALAALGDSALAAHDPVRARGYYERARERAERTGDSLALAHAGVGLGRFLVAAHRYRDAKTEFERAAVLDPASPAPFFFLGSAYAETGEEVNAIRALTAALRRGPGYAPALEALRPLMRARCQAAGLPAEYAELFLRTTVMRGELGVMLAVELGLDPDRIGWASDRAQAALPADIQGAWGERWVRAAVLRGYLRPYPDGLLHLDDPVTRGLLAITLASMERSLGIAGISPPSSGAAGEPDSLSVPPGSENPPTSRPLEFPDLGPHHFLRRAAERAVRLGLPTRPGGAFDPQAAVSGADVLRTLDRLARRAGRSPALPEELRDALVVQ